MSKKQSSIEWLYNTIDHEIVSYLDGEIDLNELSIAMLKIKEQAKAMHKEEYRLIYEGLLQNVGTSVKQNDLPTFEQYYNEIFGGQDERDRSIPQ